MRSPRRRTPAVAQGYPADYFAVINANGNTARSSGSFGSIRTAAGTYEVLFNRETLAACAYTASLAGANPGAITIQAGNAPNKLTVRTFSNTGAAANRGFHVMVMCAPSARPN